MLIDRTHRSWAVVTTLLLVVATVLYVGYSRAWPGGPSGRTWPGMLFGVVGAAGFLLVIFSLAKPLFSRVPLRRLSYTAWAFIGFAWTTPGIIDRTLWVPMALALLAALKPEAPDPPSAGLVPAGRAAPEAPPHPQGAQA